MNEWISLAIGCVAGCIVGHFIAEKLASHSEDKRRKAVEANLAAIEREERAKYISDPRLYARYLRGDFTNQKKWIRNVSEGHVYADGSTTGCGGAMGAICAVCDMNMRGIWDTVCAQCGDTICKHCVMKATSREGIEKYFCPKCAPESAKNLFLFHCDARK